MCISPADGHLYISDPEKHQILKALSLEQVQDPSINIEPVVGNGERCIPGDEGHCGDEGPAIHAKLAHPKGKGEIEMFFEKDTCIIRTISNNFTKFYEPIFLNKKDHKFKSL